MMANEVDGDMGNAWAVPDDMNQMTMDALTETDPEKRLGMYVELQKRVQANSPIVIMFQAACQFVKYENQFFT